MIALREESIQCLCHTFTRSRRSGDIKRHSFGLDSAMRIFPEGSNADFPLLKFGEVCLQRLHPLRTIEYQHVEGIDVNVLNVARHCSVKNRL